MFNFLRKLYTPIAEGNKYRATLAEELTKRPTVDPIEYPNSRSMWSESPEELEDIDDFKAQFGIWSEWSGARYVERKNPKPTRDTVPGAVCQSNSVTGRWEAI